MYSKEGKEVPWLEGFYFVPGFTRYALNRNGVLKNVATGRIINWVIAKGGGVKNITGGYRVTNIHSDDNGRRGVSRHRLLAILFIECPGEFKDYTVNHKDGIPGNDSIDNLEWCTYSINNQHAYDNGLRPNGTSPIIVRYWEDGKELKFISIAEASRSLDLPVTTLEQRLRKNNGAAYSDGLQIKSDDKSLWISPFDKIIKVRETYECIARNIKTGHSYIFNSIREAGIVLKLNDHFIRKAISEESCVPYQDYLFRIFRPDIVWPNIKTTNNSPLSE